MGQSRHGLRFRNPIGNNAASRANDLPGDFAIKLRIVGGVNCAHSPLTDGSKDKKPADGYKVPKVWKWKVKKSDPFGGMNRPVPGATHDTTLPRGKHPIQLYSLGSPNGQKVTVMFA